MHARGRREGRSASHGGRTTTWMVAARPCGVTTASRNDVLTFACSRADANRHQKPGELRHPNCKRRSTTTPCQTTIKTSARAEFTSNLPESDGHAHLTKKHVGVATEFRRRYKMRHITSRSSWPSLQGAAVANSVSAFSPGPDKRLENVK